MTFFPFLAQFHIHQHSAKGCPPPDNPCTYFHSDCDYTCPHTILELSIILFNLYTPEYYKLLTLDMAFLLTSFHC